MPRPAIMEARMDTARSPLALPFPDMPPIAGVTLRVARAHYKTWDRADLTFAELAEGTALQACSRAMSAVPPKWRWGASR